MALSLIPHLKQSRSIRRQSHSQSLDWYWQIKQYRKIHKLITTQKSKQFKIQHCNKPTHLLATCIADNLSDSSESIKRSVYKRCWIEEETVWGTFDGTGTVFTTAEKTSGRPDRNV